MSENWKMPNRGADKENIDYFLLIKRTQFPLVLAYACVVHNVSSLSIDQGFFWFQFKKAKVFLG